MKPLLMMRTKGLTGPMYAKHAGVPGLSKAGQKHASVVPPTPTVPYVRQSTIGSVQPDGITIVWDRAMVMTCDVKAQITVLVDATPVTVTDVLFHPQDKSIMGILVTPNFTAGQDVTWSYDDSGPCDIQDMAGVEADNQTYAVFNDL